MIYLDVTKVIKIFCDCDDFYKEYEQFFSQKMLKKKNVNLTRIPRLHESADTVQILHRKNIS